MPTIRWDQVQEVYVGDTLPTLRFAFTKENEQDMLDLTGYGGWVSFWGLDLPIHVVRAGAIPVPLNGELVYQLLGDEWIADPAGGSVMDVFAQASVCHPDYSTAAKGRGFFVVSHPITQWVVLKRWT